MFTPFDYNAVIGAEAALFGRSALRFFGSLPTGGLPIPGVRDYNWQWDGQRFTDSNGHKVVDRSFIQSDNINIGVYLASAGVPEYVADRIFGDFNATKNLFTTPNSGVVDKGRLYPSTPINQLTQIHTGYSLVSSGHVYS